MCVYIYIRRSSLDKIFPRPFHIVSKNMSFAACFWKSWRIKENHVEFWGRIYLQISSAPPWHLQANIFPFTHAYWWQNHIAFVWIFRFLVSPSSKKLKNTFPDWKTTRIITFLVLRAFVCVCVYLRAFAGYLQAFCGVFLSQNMSFSGFCDFCESLRFQNP